MYNYIKRRPQKIKKNRIVFREKAQKYVIKIKNVICSVLGKQKMSNSA